MTPSQRRTPLRLVAARSSATSSVHDAGSGAARRHRSHSATGEGPEGPGGRGWRGAAAQPSAAFPLRPGDSRPPRRDSRPATSDAAGRRPGDWPEACVGHARPLLPGPRVLAVLPGDLQGRRAHGALTPLDSEGVKDPRPGGKGLAGQSLLSEGRQLTPRPGTGRAETAGAASEAKPSPSPCPPREG